LEYTRSDRNRLMRRRRRGGDASTGVDELDRIFDVGGKLSFYELLNKDAMIASVKSALKIDEQNQRLSDELFETFES
jgi:hypothetical protein